MDGIQGLLAVAGAVSAIMLGWRNLQLTKGQAEVAKWSALIDDMETVIASLRAENSRLSEKVARLEASNLTLVTEQAGLRKRLAELEAIVWEEANA